MNDDWLRARIAYLQGLKSPTDHQRLLLGLASKPDRTPGEERKFSALVKAEKAAERAVKARADAARIVNADQLARRRARDHELFNAAGLLILAGLVDTHTGCPILDRGELLGALMGLAKLPLDDPRRQDWKRAGDALLAERAGLSSRA